MSERLLLDGKVAVITGAASGIGESIAARYSQEGASVLAVDRDLPKVPQGAGPIRTFQVDVTTPDAPEQIRAALVEAFGRLDILVANAGLQKDAAFRDMTLDQWRGVIETNLTGQFLCCREAVRRFLDQEEQPSLSRARGKIVCVSSVHEVIPWAGHVNYAASKGGVMLMMKSLAQEVAPHRIRVNSIAPGAIRTPINREAWETPEALGRLLKLIPYGRIGEPEDVAKAAVWLASDEADYVTGTTLFVDGGMTLYPGFEDNG